MVPNMFDDIVQGLLHVRVGFTNMARIIEYLHSSFALTD